MNILLERMKGNGQLRKPLPLSLLLPIFDNVNRSHEPLRIR
jgi:hypothetical protein